MKLINIWVFNRLWSIKVLLQVEQGILTSLSTLAFLMIDKRDSVLDDIPLLRFIESRLSKQSKWVCGKVAEFSGFSLHLSSWLDLAFPSLT
jgi:hypothetical protein